MKNWRAVLVLGASVLGLSAPAVAQDQAGVPGEPEVVSDTDGSTIVVEARRRDESAQDVPLVVNAVTAEKISQLNLRDFKEITSVVPGLTMNSGATGTSNQSSVRGVNFDNAASGSFSTVEYYLNDAPITAGALFNAMYDIGQIEVLRGPQGTLRGRASPSGSITIAHRKPDLYELGGYVLGTVNDIGGANVNAAVGAPIIPGKLAVRVAGLVERGRGTRVRSINNNADPFTRTKSGRVIARFEPVDFIRAEGAYQRIEIDALQFQQAACFDTFAPLSTPPSVAQPCPIRIDADDRLSIKKGATLVQQDFDIFTWKASAGFAGQRLFYTGGHTKQEIRSFNPQAGGGDDANVVPFVYGQNTTNQSKFTSHEIRLQNEERVAGIFDYSIGYFDFKTDTPSYLYGETISTAAFAIRPSLTVRTNSAKEEAYFGNLTVHLGDRTEISGGARHIKVDTDSRLFATPPPGLVFPPRPPRRAVDISDVILPLGLTENVFAPNPRQFEKTIYSASAKHRFSDDLMVYANFGTSFRPGNNVIRLPVNVRQTATETGFIFLPAETSKAYEVGFKSEFFDDTLKLNVAAFRQDFKNYPLRSPSGVLFVNYASLSAAPTVGTFNFVSPVPVRVEGFEVEAEWRPSDRFNLTGNLAYALGKVKNGLIACNDLNGDGVPDTTPPVGLTANQLLVATGGTVGVLGSGNGVSTCRVDGFRAASAAPWNANLQGEYSLPVASSVEGFVRGLMIYSGKSLNDPANPFDNYDAFARVNLFAGVRDADGAWDVTLYGKNVTGNDTILATGNGPAVTPVAGTNITSPYINIGTDNVPGLVAPREFGVTARFAFGSR